MPTTPRRVNPRKRAARVLVHVFWIALWAAAVLAAGDDLAAPAGKGWEEKGGGSGYRTYLRYKPGSDTAEVLMVGVVPDSPRACLAVVTSYESFPSFMPYIRFTRLLRSEKAAPGKTVNTVFFYVEAPLVSPRYYTLRLVDEENADGAAGVCRSAWELERGALRKTPKDPAFAGKIKGGNDAVETPVNSGYWRFSPLSGGRGTKVEYYVFTNPGGDIPAFVVNRSNSVALPLLWRALTKRLAESRKR